MSALGPDGQRAWDTLAQHLDWSEDRWLVFVFTQSAALSRALRGRLAQEVADQGGLRVIRPRTPQQLRELVPLVLEPTPRALTWVEAVHVDPEEGGPWREAWDWFMLRLNERRERAMRAVGQGLVLCAPTSLKPRFREAAPDLWSIRSLVLEPRTPPITDQERPEPDDPTVELDALLAQGWMSEAAPLAEEELERAQDAAEAAPANRRRQTELAEALERRGQVLRAQGDLDGAHRALADAVQLRHALADGARSRRRTQRSELARVLAMLGQLELDRSDPTALELLRESVALREALSKETGEDPESMADEALSHSLLGDGLLATGQEEAARAAFTRALDIRQEVVLVADAPRHRRWLSVAWGRMGRVLLALGDRVGARASWRRAVELARALASTDPGNATWAMEASVAECRWGDAAFADGELDVAELAWRAALRTRESLCGQDPQNAQWQEYLAVALGRIARLHAARGQTDLAVMEAQRALEVSQALASDTPGNPRWARGVRRAEDRLQEITSQTRLLD